MKEKWILANWKMNLTKQEAIGLFDFYQQIVLPSSIKLLVAAPFVYLPFLIPKNNAIALAAQNCAAYEKGAYTGEVSAAMLKEIGVNYCLIGHSERRTIFGEEETILKQKLSLALEQNLKVIFCVGESKTAYEKSQTWAVLKEQLRIFEEIEACFYPQIFIAYEPLWAIGTGLFPEKKQMQELSEQIKNHLAKQNFPLLYGGSCQSDNIENFYPYFDGFLVGGASLKRENFEPFLNFFI